MTANEKPADPITTLRQQLQRLKTLHEEGTLGAEAYASARAPLERELLDRVLAQPAADAEPAAALAPAPPPRPSKPLLGGVAVAVLALAVGGYLGFGSPGMPSAGPPGSAPEVAAAAPDMTEAQFVAAVEQLA